MAETIKFVKSTSENAQAPLGHLEVTRGAEVFSIPVWRRDDGSVSLGHCRQFTVVDGVRCDIRGDERSIASVPHLKTNRAALLQAAVAGIKS